MRLRFFVFGFACGIAAIVATRAVNSGGPPDREEAEKMWRKFAFPSEAHRHLEVYEGTWDVTIKGWWEGPDKPPTVNHAISRNKSIFGGRFIETRLNGMMVYEIDGEKQEVPMEGIGYTGYDNFKEKYISVWLDSHGTGIWFSEGTASDDGRKFTYIATYDDWMKQQRDKPYMIVDTVLNEDRIVSNLHDLSMGPDMERNRVWQMTFARRDDPYDKRSE